jgi:arylsulfatase A-like enzyme
LGGRLRRFFALSVLAATLAAASVQAPAVARSRNGPSATKPNIIVFYVDDVPPTDGRLWNNPALTPNLYNLFTARGIKFNKSIGETPLCCPGRTGLLTGLHTHNTGVLVNDARLFDPRETVGKELKGAGYASMWIGKYLNRNDLLTASQWTEHGAGWTVLDAVYGTNGAFYNYKVHTKTGFVYYPTTHSTRMVGDRAVMHLRETPTPTPVFAVLSVYDLHLPNKPETRFVGDPRCANMPPWDPPNYNEADVSDKPSYVADQPLLPYPDGWPMVTYCEEMLGVDQMVGQVVDELKADGRFDNTMFVFTADNGMTWGAHRLGEKKIVPYAAPVPLYFDWPARWGSNPRTIDDFASNIDLGPTFCVLGGCTMSHYYDGRPGPDGVSLLPLLDGTKQNIGRDAVLESAFTGVRTWFGLRTTPSNPLGLWHYVEWADGEKELYDEVNDRWELQNVAGVAQYSQLEAQLHTRLALLKREGARAHPDAAVSKTTSAPWVGDWLTDTLPATEQTISRTVAAGHTYTYTVRVTNRGGFSDRFLVSASSNGSSHMTVTYWRSGTNITAAVVAGTYKTLRLGITESTRITVQVVVAASAVAGDIKRVVVTAKSVADPTHIDVVRATSTVG